MPWHDRSLPIFVATAPGLERTTAMELSRLGFSQYVVQPGGIALTGSLVDVMRANLHLRTATRVLVRLAEFRATAFHELERGARRVPWADLLRPDQAARLRVTCRKSRLYHSDAVAQRVADAIARVSSEPVVTAQDAEDESERGDAQLIVVRVQQDRVTISADSSGDRLHRRGYREAIAKAPLRETLAAAMLLECAWSPGAPLSDPFCGSGTIVIEGAMIARGIAPGLRRAEGGGFAFERWPGFEGSRWRSLVDDAAAAIRPPGGIALRGTDRDEGAIAASRSNAERAGVASDVSFEQLPVSAVNAGPERGSLVTNPPYGVRVGEHASLRNLYDVFGRVLRERFTGWAVAILSPGGELESRLRVPLDVALTTRNGGIPVRLLVGRLREGEAVRPR